MLPRKLFSLPFAISAAFAEKRKSLRGCIGSQSINASPGNDGRRSEARRLSKTRRKRMPPCSRFPQISRRRARQSIWSEARPSGAPFARCHLT